MEYAGGAKAMSDEELIERHVVPDPQKSGRAHARVQPSNVSVWVIASDLSRGATADQILSDYDLLPEELQAAKAYYCRHKDLFDAYLLLVRDAWEATVP
jgi:uncharacterized protein (DUF433 family)